MTKDLGFNYDRPAKTEMKRGGMLLPLRSGERRRCPILYTAVSIQETGKLGYPA